MKLVVRLKGGKGSGHHGHSGRPGKVGGSVAGKGVGESTTKYVTYVDTYNNLSAVKSNEPHVSYFITYDNKVLDIGYGTHSGYIRQLMKESTESFSALGVDSPTQSITSNFDAAMIAGSIRVYATPRTIAIDTAQRDKRTLRRLQRLVDEGKIDFIDENGKFKALEWGNALKYNDPVIKATYEEFLSAKYVSEDGYSLK
jgi:hypothetical protein